MAIVTIFPDTTNPVSAEMGGITINAEEMAALLSKAQDRDRLMGYRPRKCLDANQIIQELHWKAERLGTPLPDDSDPDPRERW